ncbi:hypothetical protein DFP72DRAFT_1152945 [Ephemerocybe angulata]|uniref:Uncharacterized protein n=1 Tax=Ephemerocybe angulata TaxID=980116 RepID=A0A8H6LZE0_9AGAR|nr:hypothetical protein DFP72DRAFT_1152945 [Tulosesus angulatus]
MSTGFFTGQPQPNRMDTAAPMATAAQHPDHHPASLPPTASHASTSSEMDLQPDFPGPMLPSHITFSVSPDGPTSVHRLASEADLDAAQTSAPPTKRTRILSQDERKRDKLRSCRRCKSTTCDGKWDIRLCPHPCLVPCKKCGHYRWCKGVDGGRKCAYPDPVLPKLKNPSKKRSPVSKSGQLAKPSHIAVPSRPRLVSLSTRSRHRLDIKEMSHQSSPATLLNQDSSESSTSSLPTSTVKPAKRGRPKGSKDKPRASDAPPRGRPRKQTAAALGTNTVNREDDGSGAEDEFDALFDNAAFTHEAMNEIQEIENAFYTTQESRPPPACPNLGACPRAAAPSGRATATDTRAKHGRRVNLDAAVNSTNTLSMTIWIQEVIQKGIRMVKQTRARRLERLRQGKA